jgi:hypothetical protein
MTLKGTDLDQMFTLQKGLCFWCGREMLPIGSPDCLPLSPTRDHIIPKAAKPPKAKPGSLSENVKACCYECNNLRSSFNPEAIRVQREEQQRRIDKHTVTIGKLKDLVVEQETIIKRLSNQLLDKLETSWWKRIWRK